MKNLNIARGFEPAQIVMKNAKLINVLSGVIEEVDIAIDKGIIVGVGSYHGKEEIDLKGAFLAPGLIDGHVHIESSMLTPPEFSKIIVSKGTTTIIADPHEIANVSGLAGIEFMLKSSEDIPLNVYMMAPSCVPATELENAGATISVDDIKTLKGHPRVLGLGEVMDYPAVLEGETTIHQKIMLMKGHPIDGHAPDILGKDLNAYILAGVQTDHESTQLESLIERVNRGMYVHLREGSATRNVKTLLKGVTSLNHHRLMFCTDDKHPEDIIKEGHINYNVNLAIQSGIDPMIALRMATFNTAQCYGLKNLGAIAPGYRADFIVFSDLNNIQPHLVYKDGVLVAKDGIANFDVKTHYSDAVMESVKVDLSSLDFTLNLKQPVVRVIGLIENNITTRTLKRRVDVVEGVYQNNQDQDILKLAVIERHKNTKNVGLGLVEGYGIKDGAVALSIAHDSHNIIVIGDSDQAMKIAVDKLVHIQGGIVVVNNQKVVDELPLEVSGIMTNANADDVQNSLIRMTKRIEAMGLSEKIDDPFITLAFLSLPVIPELKLTDTGLFDVKQFKKVAIEWDDDE